MRTSSGEHLFAPHPLALLFVAFAAGIVYAHFLPTHLYIFVFIGAASAALSCLALSGLAQHSSRRLLTTLAAFVLALAFMFTGAILETVDEGSPSANQIKRLIEDGSIKSDGAVEVIGVLDRPLEYTPTGFYLTLAVEKLRSPDRALPASGVVQLLVQAHDHDFGESYKTLGLHYGARVRLVTVLERSENYRNPGVSQLSEFLDRKGFDATGKIKSPSLIEPLDDTRVFVLLRWLYDWRHCFEREIHRNFSAETAGVLDASLLGNRYFLSKQSAERFREGGTFHVLVISGLHISVIGGAVLLLARRLTKRKWLQFLVANVVLWAYTLAVGADPSVVRAALMFSLVALAPLVARSANSLNALGGAGLALIIWRPRDLFDPSFQLTFLSVLAIVTIAIPLVRKLTAIGAWQPTRQTPYPPICAEWLRVFCESIYWSERHWRREIAKSNFGYRLFKTPYAGWLERHHLQLVLRHTMSALIVSASVQVCLLPLLILYFHRLSFSALFLNIFVSGLMALLSVIAVFGLCVAQLSHSAAEPLSSLASGVDWLMVHSVDLFAIIGHHSWRLPEYSGWPAIAYLIYYGPLLVLVSKLGNWNPLSQPRASRISVSKRSAVVLSLQLSLIGLLVGHPFSATRLKGRLEVDFLDVGQGDAALVTMPDGTTLMIDGGGRPGFGPARTSEDQPIEQDARSVGERVVSEYLWWRGLDSIDYVIATHADADHIDGLNDVVNNFRVRSALVARTPVADPEFVKFSETLRRRTTPLNLIGAGDVLEFGDVKVLVVWPQANDSPDAPSRNNDSVVLQLNYGKRAVLMTGDIEKEAESAIVRFNSDLKNVVVKVPHHGSKTSSTESFVWATQPCVAVISVGLQSRFGHPRPEVVARWQSGGADVMTTGKKGTITVTTNGKDLQVQSFVR